MNHGVWLPQLSGIVDPDLSHRIYGLLDSVLFCSESGVCPTRFRIMGNRNNIKGEQRLSNVSQIKSLPLFIVSEMKFLIIFEVSRCQIVHSRTIQSNTCGRHEVG